MTNQDERTEYDSLHEIQTSSEEIFDGVILHVFKDRIQLPNGDDSSREIIRHIGAVCVVPVTDDGMVVLERQYRYPLDQVITEIPAGKLDWPEEDRLEAAQRELSEETGYTADNWVDMGLFYPAAAYSDEKITMYLATGLHKGQQKLDSGELLNVIEIPLTEAVEQVMSGQITDSKTQTGILKAAQYLQRECKK